MKISIAILLIITVTALFAAGADPKNPKIGFFNATPLPVVTEIVVVSDSGDASTAKLGDDGLYHMVAKEMAFSFTYRNAAVKFNVVTNTTTEPRTVTFTNRMIECVTTNAGGAFTNLVPVMTVGTNVGGPVEGKQVVVPWYPYTGNPTINLGVGHTINGSIQ